MKIRPELTQLLEEISKGKKNFDCNDLNCLFKQYDLNEAELEAVNKASTENHAKINNKIERDLQEDSKKMVDFRTRILADQKDGDLQTN